MPISFFAIIAAGVAVLAQERWIPIEAHDERLEDSWSQLMPPVDAKPRLLGQWRFEQVRFHECLAQYVGPGATKNAPIIGRDGAHVFMLLASRKLASKTEPSNEVITLVGPPSPQQNLTINLANVIEADGRRGYRVDLAYDTRSFFTGVRRFTLRHEDAPDPISNPDDDAYVIGDIGPVLAAVDRC